MRKFNLKVIGFCAAVFISASAHSFGVPVIDPALIESNEKKHFETIGKWLTQLESMETELKQTKGIWDSLKGGRAMGNILIKDLSEQFLPQDYWAIAEQIRNGKGDFNGISGRVSDIVKAYQYKSCAELNKDPILRKQCEDQWRSMAMRKDFGDMAYKKAAENIQNLQVFIKKINGSTDQKEISEIQARIDVEQVRMQNEMMKLTTIAKMEEAEKEMRTQRANDAFQSGLRNFDRPKF